MSDCIRDIRDWLLRQRKGHEHLYTYLVDIDVIGGADMADNSRYNKPSMTNLPRELGVAIFKQILNSPAPDREKMRAESRRLVKGNVKVRERELAQGN